MNDVLEAARRIVAWDDSGRLADDEWLVEKNETAIIAICRALLGLREALEKAGAQFRFYEREHQAKADAVYAVSGPSRDEYEKRRVKATTNKEFADMCDAAIEKATTP